MTLDCDGQRAVYYGNRAACKVNLHRWEEALVDCTKAIELNKEYTKVILRRAQVHDELEKEEEALRGKHRSIL